MGMSGLAFAGPDVGGFVGDRTPELFARWLSIGTFTPFFRNHASHNTQDHEPWAFGEMVEDISRRYLNMRYQLLPYTYSVFYEASTSGMPVARSLAINNTFDQNVYKHDFQNQFLFGPSFLVAPVVSTQKFAKVYLPQGEWYSLWDDKKYSGGQEILVEAPLDKLPVFVKSGSIVPKQSVIQYTNQAVSDTLTIHVYAGKDDNTFTYYEDDGNTFNYKEGSFYKREITYLSKGEIQLGKVEGSMKSKFKYASIIMHDGNSIKEGSVIEFDNKERKVKLQK